MFQGILRYWPDGPTIAQLKFMHLLGPEPPSNWDGYHTLDEEMLNEINNLPDAEVQSWGEVEVPEVNSEESSQGELTEEQDRCDRTDARRSARLSRQRACMPFGRQVDPNGNMLTQLHG